MLQILSHSGRRIVLSVTVAGILLFYYWSAASSNFDLTVTGPKDDYYNRLTDAFRAGQLHLLLEPHPALLALPDPYDPVANRAYRVHDASLYHGKYYLYFGVGPILTLLLPFNLLTGAHVPPALAILIFGTIGYLCGVTLLLRIRADYFKTAPIYAESLSAIMLGIATYVPLLLRRSMVYEVAVASGFCWSMVMLLGVYGAGHTAQRRGWWLTLVGLSGGLAVASRPNLAPGITLVILLTALVGCLRETEARKRWVNLLALGAPYATVAVGLMAYNFARFDNPFEFGMRYALAGYDMTRWPAFSLHYLPTSLAYHLFSHVGFTPYFPFVYPAGLDLAHVAKGYALTESVIGILPALPVTWLGLAVPWLVWRWRKQDFLGWFVAISFALGLMNLFMHGCFGAATARYQVDFLPPLLLACAIIALAILSWKGPLALLYRTGVTAVLAYSVVFGLFFSLQYLDILRYVNPATFRSFASVFNRPVAIWEQAHGSKYGPLRLKLRIPAHPSPGAYETLLHTGREGLVNCIYVNYLPDGMARIGLYRTGSGGPVSAPFPLTPGAEAEVEIHHGSLLPPFGHPDTAPLSLDEDGRLRRLFTVFWNGRSVLQASIPSHEATFFQRAIAGNQPTPGPYPNFSGQLLSSEYLPWDHVGSAPPGSPAQGGIKLKVLFPMERGPGRDPLVAVPAAPGFLLYVQYEDAGRLRFGVAHPGYDDILSEPQTVDFLRPHLVEFSTEAFYPGNKATTGPAPADRLEMKLDGEVLIGLGLASPVGERFPAVFYGSNPQKLADAPADFLGNILSIERIPRIAPPLRAEDTAIGPAVISSSFPLAMIGQTEPLVVTGRTGRGDFVLIKYLDKDHVAFAYDHWGYGGDTGTPVKVDYTEMHRMEISLGTLFPPDRIPASVATADAQRVRDFVQVTLDGKIVFLAPAKPYDCLPSEIYFATNPIGGSSCRDRFTGHVTFIKRLSWP